MSRDLCTCRREHGPVWLVPPPGLADVTADPRPAGAYAWALDGPDAARRVWREQARLGLALLERRLERPGADGDRFARCGRRCG
jgi:hypothetical protein